MRHMGFAMQCGREPPVDGTLLSLFPHFTGSGAGYYNRNAWTLGNSYYFLSVLLFYSLSYSYGTYYLSI
jgi:hypothetical protein